MTVKVLTNGFGVIHVFHNPGDLDRLIKRLTDLKASTTPADYPAYAYDVRTDATEEQLAEVKLVALGMCAEVKKMR